MVVSMGDSEEKFRKDLKDQENIEKNSLCLKSSTSNNSFASRIWEAGLSVVRHVRESQGHVSPMEGRKKHFDSEHVRESCYVTLRFPRISSSCQFLGFHYPNVNILIGYFLLSHCSLMVGQLTDIIHGHLAANAKNCTIAIRRHTVLNSGRDTAF
jgi:hypothetical protein